MCLTSQVYEFICCEFSALALQFNRYHILFVFVPGTDDVFTFIQNV